MKRLSARKTLSLLRRSFEVEDGIPRASSMTIRSKGLVRCGNCKRAMTRRKNKTGIRYFQCIHSVNNGNTDCPVGRSFPEMDIEKVVFHALTQFLASAQKEAVQNREVGDLRKSAIKECADKIRILQKQNEQHKASKLRLYESTQPEVSRRKRTFSKDGNGHEDC